MKKKLLTIALSAMLAIATASAPVAAANDVFDDVTDSSKYYYKPVYWAREAGITSGATATLFKPGDTCTRGQIVTFLWKMQKQPEATKANIFTDVASGSFYETAATWAAENGITNGMTPTTFAPGDPCTRAQIVTFLWNLAGKPEASSGVNFSDVPATSYYAKAVAWASSKAIVSGLGGLSFGPNQPCTRAQTVAILYKYAANGQEVNVNPPTTSQNSTTPQTDGVKLLETYGYNYTDILNKKCAAYGFTIKSNLPYDVQSTEVRVTIKDSTGKVLKSDTELLGVLKSGDTLAKCDHSEIGGEGADFKIEVVSAGTKVDGSKVQASSAFETLQVNETLEDSTGDSKITGEIQNSSDRFIANTEVSILAIKNGKVVDGTYTYVDNIAAGGTTSFETYSSYPLRPHDSLIVIVADMTSGQYIAS